MGVSQSGETLDTLQALREARRWGAKVLVVTNVVDSSMAREADGVLYTRAGPEVGVASTKCHLAQIVALELLALNLAQLRGTRTAAEIGGLLDRLHELPGQGGRGADPGQGGRRGGRGGGRGPRLLLLGRGVGYPVALEGALKLKEISYLRAEGYAAGELKHGPIALIVPGTVVVGVANRTPLQEKMLANVAEVKSRGATVVLVADDGDAEAAAAADHVLWVPPTEPLLAPVVDVVPLQLLAYRLARLRGQRRRPPAQPGQDGDRRMSPVVGVGVDAVDVDRFRRVLGRRPGLPARLFSQDERDDAARAGDPAERLAARFAAKEAVMKALGSGIGVVRAAATWRWCGPPGTARPRGRPRSGWPPGRPSWPPARGLALARLAHPHRPHGGGHGGGRGRPLMRPVATVAEVRAADAAALAQREPGHPGGAGRHGGGPLGPAAARLGLRPPGGRGGRQGQQRGRRPGGGRILRPAGRPGDRGRRRVGPRAARPAATSWSTPPTAPASGAPTTRPGVPTGAAGAGRGRPLGGRRGHRRGRGPAHGRRPHRDLRRLKPGLLQGDGAAAGRRGGGGRHRGAGRGDRHRAWSRTPTCPALVPRRARESHKWASAVAVVAGSPGMEGAAALAAAGASHAGAGMVRLAVPGQRRGGRRAIWPAGRCAWPCPPRGGPTRCWPCSTAAGRWWSARGWPSLARSPPSTKACWSPAPPWAPTASSPSKSASNSPASAEKCVSHIIFSGLRFRRRLSRPKPYRTPDVQDCTAWEPPAWDTPIAQAADLRSGRLQRRRKP